MGKVSQIQCWWKEDNKIKKSITSQELSHDKAVFKFLSAQHDCDDKFQHI